MSELNDFLKARKPSTLAEVQALTSQFLNSYVDSHPDVLEDNERRRKIIKKHTLPKLREMIKVLGIKKMSGKNKSELVEALVDADWDGESNK